MLFTMAKRRIGYKTGMVDLHTFCVSISSQETFFEELLMLSEVTIFRVKCLLTSLITRNKEMITNISKSSLFTCQPCMLRMQPWHRNALIFLKNWVRIAKRNSQKTNRSMHIGLVSILLQSSTTILLSNTADTQLVPKPWDVKIQKKKRSGKAIDMDNDYLG